MIVNSKSAAIFQSATKFSTRKEGIEDYSSVYTKHRNWSDNDENISIHQEGRGKCLHHCSIINNIYNHQDGLLFGRLPRDFVFLLVYFFLFYTLLACFFALLMWPIFQFIILADRPYLTGKHSVLRGNPGLAVVPSPDRLTALIAFKISQRYTSAKYVDQLTAFTQYYDKEEGTSTDFMEECYQTGSRSLHNDRVSCRQSLDIGGRCNRHQSFGFDEGMPCVILKLNRIYGWLPETYENTTGVEVVCAGRTASDRDNIGELCYYDDDTLNLGQSVCKRNKGVFKSYYFPYLRQMNYQSPIVYVEFVNIKKFVTVMVDCWAIAKNIKVDTEKSEGSVRFELYVY